MLKATKLKLNHLRFTFALRKINFWGPSSWFVGGYLWPSTGLILKLLMEPIATSVPWAGQSNMSSTKDWTQRRTPLLCCCFSVKQVLHYCDKSINKTNFCVALAKNWHSYLVMKENILPGTFPCSLLADLIYCGVLIFSWSYDGVLWLWLFLRWL